MSDQVAELEAQLDDVRAERDAANDEFRRRLRTLSGQIKVVRAQAALDEAQAQVAAQGISLESATTQEEG